CQVGFGNCDRSSLDCEAAVGSPAGTCFPRYLGTSLVVDVDHGYIAATAVAPDGATYFAGQFAGNVDLDPTGGLDLFTSGEQPDAFITKLNPDGKYAWSRTLGADQMDGVVALALAPDGSVIAGGFYGGTVDFDPGPGVDFHTNTVYGEPFVL